jgi:hypothetical protein
MANKDKRRMIPAEVSRPELDRAFEELKRFVADAPAAKEGTEGWARLKGRAKAAVRIVGAWIKQETRKTKDPAKLELTWFRRRLSVCGISSRVVSSHS